MFKILKTIVGLKYRSKVLISPRLDIEEAKHTLETEIRSEFKKFNGNVKIVIEGNRISFTDNSPHISFGTRSTTRARHLFFPVQGGSFEIEETEDGLLIYYSLNFGGFVWFLLALCLLFGSAVRHFEIQFPYGMIFLFWGAVVSFHLIGVFGTIRNMSRYLKRILTK